LTECWERVEELRLEDPHTDGEYIEVDAVEEETVRGVPSD
jgi:hypothetical protein